MHKLAKKLLDQGTSYFEAIHQLETALVDEALIRTGGNTTKAGVLLKVKRPTLVEIRRRLGFDIAPAPGRTYDPAQ